MQDSPALAYHVPAQPHVDKDIYRTALRTGGLVTWETDFENRTRLWTQEAAELFGIDVPCDTPISIDGPDHLRDTIHPEDRTAIDAARERMGTVDETDVAYRIVRNREVRHLAGTGRVIRRDGNGSPLRVCNIVGDVTEQTRIREHNADLQDELRHRSKNMLGVVASIARQLSRRSPDLTTFQTAFDRRLEGLAASFNLLTDGAAAGASLDRVVASQLRSFVTRDDERVEVDCVPIVISANAAEKLGMALHELATNAIKYGALSVPDGQVQITGTLRRCDKGERLLMSWQERNGPRVNGDAPGGFGSLVAGRMIARGLDADVAHEFHADGVVWKLDVDAGNVRLRN